MLQSTTLSSRNYCCETARGELLLIGALECLIEFTSAVLRGYIKLPDFAPLCFSLERGTRLPSIYQKHQSTRTSSKTDTKHQNIDLQPESKLYQQDEPLVCLRLSPSLPYPLVLQDIAGCLGPDYVVSKPHPRGPLLTFRLLITISTCKTCCSGQCAGTCSCGSCKVRPPFNAASSSSALDSRG